MPAEHHEAGVALASQRRFAEAVKEYREAARLNANFSETFYNLGVAYGELGQLMPTLGVWSAIIVPFQPRRSVERCEKVVECTECFLFRDVPCRRVVIHLTIRQTEFDHCFRWTSVIRIACRKPRVSFGVTQVH